MTDPVPADRPKGRSLKPLRALLPFLRPHVGTMLLALGALLVAAAAMLALPVALRYLIDEGMAAGSAETINRYFVAFLAAAAVFGVFAALRFYLVTWLGERVVADLRQAVYDRVIRMDPALLRGHAHRRGAVASHRRHHARAVHRRREPLHHAALDHLGGGQPGHARGDEPEAHRDHRRADPAADRAALILGRRVRKLSRTSQDRIADTSGLADETLNAIQTVQAFTLEDSNSERFGAAVEDSFDAAVKRTRVRSTLTAVATMLVFGAITFVLWVGAHDVIRGDDDRRRAEPVPALCGLRGGGRSLAERDVGRGAARRRRDGAAGRAAARRAAHRRPRQSGAAAEPGPRRDPLRARELPLSVAAGHAGARRVRPRGAPGRDGRLRRARRAPARARPSSCCCASTTRSPGAS